MYNKRKVTKNVVINDTYLKNNLFFANLLAFYFYCISIFS